MKGEVGQRWSLDPQPWSMTISVHLVLIMAAQVAPVVCPHYLPEFAQIHSTESVMLSNHLIPCHPLLLFSIFPGIRVFSDELALHIRWPKYCSFSFSIGPVIYQIQLYIYTFYFIFLSIMVYIRVLNTVPY